MLRACRRVLRPGGRIAGATIEPAPGLGAADRRRAHRSGPVAVAVRTSYPSLYRSAGLELVDQSDVTREYRSTLTAWIRAFERRADAIADAVGAAAFAERLATRRRALAAIDAGLLIRSRYVAHRPPRTRPR